MSTFIATKVDAADSGNFNIFADFRKTDLSSSYQTYFPVFASYIIFYMHHAKSRLGP